MGISVHAPPRLPVVRLQDADSLDEASGEKKEGAFYVWGADEIASILGGLGCEGPPVLLGGCKSSVAMNLQQVVPGVLSAKRSPL